MSYVQHRYSGFHDPQEHAGDIVVDDALAVEEPDEVDLNEEASPNP